MLRKNFPNRKEQKRNEAHARQVERAARSPQEQLQMLDHRFGPSVGATKERLKLLNTMENKNVSSTSEGSPAVPGTEAST